MAVRLLNYLDLLYQDLIRSRQLGRCRRLPPVMPVVLYNGRRPWTAATELADLVDPGPPELDTYRPRLRYRLIDESTYADAELATMRNLVAALFRLENSRSLDQTGNRVGGRSFKISSLRTWTPALVSGWVRM